MFNLVVFPERTNSFETRRVLAYSTSIGTFSLHEEKALADQPGNIAWRQITNGHLAVLLTSTATGLLCEGVLTLRPQPHASAGAG